MSDIQKVIAAVIGVFVAGFIMVGASKEKTTAELEAESMIRNTAALREMAAQKCPKAIEKHTGDQVYVVADTETDNATFITLKWVGEKGDHFQTAECTLHVTLGGISKLVIDGKAVIDKKI